MRSFFAEAETWRPTQTGEHRGVELPLAFADAAHEYQAARSGPVIFDRSDRALLRVTGKDARPWLHNLVTNAVKTLNPGSGCYAFVVDVRGRIQFDLNILARENELWLDVDRAAAPALLQYLEKYHILEDVNLSQETERPARLAMGGNLDALNHPLIRATLAGQEFDQKEDCGIVAFRHDFLGRPGVEMLFPAHIAPRCWDGWVREHRVQPVGLRVLDVLRIEAGIPWLGRELDDRALPPETGQVARGVSYRKGCYLGQEVLERMRSHNVLARRLVRLRAGARGAEWPSSCPLLRDGTEVGRVTSMVTHPLTHDWVGLGYLKTSVAAPTRLQADDREVEVSELHA